MNAADFERALRAAFPVEPVPLPAALVGHNPACEECVALRESLAGKRWDALDDAWLALHDADLPLLTGTAFRYHLPAFLLRAAREPHASGSSLVVLNLSPFSRGALDPSMLERLAPLKPEQREVIRAFLDERRRTQALDEPERARAAEALAFWSGGAR